MACGQSLAAVRSGMAECTPNLRASLDAAETTPRSSRCPPTTTALPFSSGANSSSTDTKKASMSTWKMVRAKVLMGTPGQSATRFYQDGGALEWARVRNSSTTKDTKYHEGTRLESCLRLTSCPWWFMPLATELGHRQSDIVYSLLTIFRPEEGPE